MHCTKMWYESEGTGADSFGVVMPRLAPQEERWMDEQESRIAAGLQRIAIVIFARVAQNW